MQLYCTITANNGQRVPLLLEETTPPTKITPTQMRLKVSETTRIPLKDLRLIFRGRMIKDDESLDVVAEYKLEIDSVLHCMGKPTPASADDDAAAATAAASAPDTTTNPNRTVVPPLSASTAASTSSSAATATASATATLTAPATNGNDPLSKALARLKQNNPPSVYATAVGTLEKVLSNITNNPLEEKYRKVKRTNAAFGKRLGKLVGGHDCMLATGFAVEHQGGEEVYQLHASAEQWSGLVKAKAAIAAAAAAAKLEQEQARQRPTAGFGASTMPAAPGASAGGGGGMGMDMDTGAGMGMGGFSPPNMNDPNVQNMMSQMMSNPEALGQAMQVSR